MAAASQRTSRIELGTAVTPLAWENPLRLAEDLATVDLLSGGRVNPGVSVGPPMRWDDVREALYPDTAEVEDFGYGRVSRFLRMVGGEPVTTAGTQGIEVFSDRVEPHSPGLRDRVWYGAGSFRSAHVGGGATAEPADLQRAHRGRERRLRRPAGRPDRRLPGAPFPAGRVSQGLVVIPTDTATGAQREKYEAYAAARLPRTRRAAGSGQAALRPRRRRDQRADRRAAVRPRRLPRRSPRSPSRCRSASTTRTTCRSSPTWPPASARPWAGPRPAEAAQSSTDRRVAAKATASPPRSGWNPACPPG